MAQFHVSKKKRYEDEDGELLKKVSGHLITKETLSEKLAQHVEQVSLLVDSVLRFDLTFYRLLYVLFHIKREEQFIVYGLSVE